MATTVEITFLLAITLAAVCGAAAGRPFAQEGENRRTSILAAAYCGAGAGLLSASLLAIAVALIATILDPRDLLIAGRVIGPALFWGTVTGAGGGLVVGILVASFKRYEAS